MIFNLNLLITITLFLGSITKIKGGLYSATYEADDGHYNQGLKHTIHTLKGHYNEHAKRFTNCGSPVEDKKDKAQITSEIPDTKVENPTSEQLKARQRSATSEISTMNDSFTTTEKVTTKNNHIQLSTNLDELVKVENKSSVLNETKMAERDETDIELGILREILRDLESSSSPTRRVNNEDDSNINSTSQATPSLNYRKDSVVDSTEKHFEFESIIIHNEADKEISKNLEDLLNKVRDGADDIKEKDTRRFMPSDGDQEPDPIDTTSNDSSSSENPLPRNNAEPEVMQDNLQEIPKTQNEIKANFQVTGVVTYDNSSEYKEENTANELDDSEASLFNDSDISLEEISRASHPTKGFGISDMDRSNLMLINHPRVCFACSSSNDPSCWSPGVRTPAKYCRRDHDACVAKTYRHRGYAFIVRDCDNACRNNGLGDLGLLYQSCTICHSDMCNSALSVITSLKTIVFVLLTSVWFKYIQN